MIEKAIYALLKARPELVALVGTRIYPVKAPDRTAYPYLCYSIITDQSFNAMSRDAVPHRARVQVSSYHQDWKQVQAVDEQVRLALSRKRGTAGSATVQDIFEDGVVDLNGGEVGEGTFQRARDFTAFVNIGS